MPNVRSVLRIVGGVRVAVLFENSIVNAIGGTGNPSVRHGVRAIPFRRFVGVCRSVPPPFNPSRSELLRVVGVALLPVRAVHGYGAPPGPLGPAWPSVIHRALAACIHPE